MDELPLPELEKFIVRAKSATYIGSGEHVPSHRPASVDLEYQEGSFSYLDGYFGGSDFIGEEVVYYNQRPVWAMNYYGRILETSRITAAEAGQILKVSLSEMYKEGRFLGGFQYTTPNGIYTDTSQGDFTSFIGKEWITRAGMIVYELYYHGGLIKE